MVMAKVDVLGCSKAEGGVIYRARRPRLSMKVGRRIMPGDESDRRLYETLGKIQGTLEAHGREAERSREEVREEMRRIASEAERSRDQLHNDISKLTNRVGDVEKKVGDADMKAEAALNQVTAMVPTITEHQEIRFKADGMTIALKHIGKIVYLTGAAFIAMVGTSVAYLMHLFGSSGLPPGK